MNYLGQEFRKGTSLPPLPDDLNREDTKAVNHLNHAYVWGSYWLSAGTFAGAVDYNTYTWLFYGAA